MATKRSKSKGGKQRTLHQAGFTGDSRNMRSGTEGRGGYWLLDQVPIAHVGASPKLDTPWTERVFKDLSYYDKFAPRSVGTYDWARMA